MMTATSQWDDRRATVPVVEALMPRFVTRSTAMADWIASLRGTMIVGGLALLGLALLTFPDPRLDDVPGSSPIIAVLCGVGGGYGLSAMFTRPTRQKRTVVGICMLLVGLARGIVFTYTAIRGGGFGTILTVIPIVTMTFPFLLGIGLWRGAYQIPPRPGRLERE